VWILHISSSHKIPGILVVFIWHLLGFLPCFLYGTDFLFLFIFSIPNLFNWKQKYSHYIHQILISTQKILLTTPPSTFYRFPQIIIYRPLAFSHR
jgi:hypothetical protein